MISHFCQDIGNGEHHHDDESVVRSDTMKQYCLGECSMCRMSIIIIIIIIITVIYRIVLYRYECESHFQMLNV